MRKATKRFVLSLMGLVSLAAALASPVTAVTWHQTGDTAFTATGGPVTLAVTGVVLGCGGPSVLGTSPAGSSTGHAADLGTLSVTYSCPFMGVPAQLACNVTFTGGPATGQAFDGSAHFGCSMTDRGVEFCKLEGQTPMTYHNPVAPSTFGRFTLPLTASLKMTDGAGGICLFGAGEPLTVTGQTFALTAAAGGPSAPHLGPRLTRTA